MRTLIALFVFAALGACTITAEGPRFGVLPPSVQGSDDVQGSPLSVPGAGMGVGAGSTGTPSPSQVDDAK